MWTQRSGDEFSLQTYLFTPPDIPGGLYENGPVKVDQNFFMLVAEREVATNVASVPLSDRGQVLPESPKASLRYLHPSLDYTGKRVLFAGGDAWGPELTATQAGATSGGTAIYFGRHDDARRVSEPPAGGAGMDAYPVMDQEGRYAYFSRFLYRVSSSETPGWYLMRVSREAIEAGRAGEEEFLEADGGRVAGYQPALDSTGQFLFFVRQDPLNVGSDLWVMRVLPDPDSPRLLVQGEGESFSMPTPGSARGPWVDYELRQGRARISHPSVSADGRFLAYACDRDGDWDVYAIRLERSGDDMTASGEERVQPQSDTDTSDEMWPSISGDGAYVAFMSNRESSDPSSPETAGGRTRIWVAGVEMGGGPVGELKLVADPGASDEQLWPNWDQDEDPPHLLIMLHTSGGAEPTKIQIVDQNPDPLLDSASAQPSDIASLSLRVADYYPGAPPPGEGSDLPPIEFGFGGSEKPVHVQYEVDAPGVPGDVGVNPFGGSQINRGNSLHLLLSKKRDGLGLHRGMGKVALSNLGATSGPGSPKTIQDDAFDGLYLFENQRLAISVYARDNRWLRVGPTSDVASLYSTDLRVEEAQLRPEDQRSLPDGPAKPPYLRQRQPEEIFEQNYPGVAWWIEEGPRWDKAEGKDEAKLEPPRHKNAPFIIFRFANYPPSQYTGDSSRDKDIYLRVVARDLLGNFTDVRIPLHIRGKDFQVNTLDSGSQRRSQ